MTFCWVHMSEGKFSDSVANLVMFAYSQIQLFQDLQIVLTVTDQNIQTLFNPYTASHNNCRLLCHLLVILKVISANSVDPD